MANVCEELPTFEADLNVADTFSLTLKPLPPVNGEAQYWPLYNQASPSEQFGDILFKFNGQNKKITLNITLDTSELEGVEFTKAYKGDFDGVVGLSPEFKQEFKSKAQKGADGNYSELKIAAKVNKSDEDGDGNSFSFLWLCEMIDSGMNVVSGDPMARYDPE